MHLEIPGAHLRPTICPRTTPKAVKTADDREMAPLKCFGALSPKYMGCTFMLIPKKQTCFLCKWTLFMNEWTLPWGMHGWFGKCLIAVPAFIPIRTRESMIISNDPAARLVRANRAPLMRKTLFSSRHFFLCRWKKKKTTILFVSLRFYVIEQDKIEKWKIQDFPIYFANKCLKFWYTFVHSPSESIPSRTTFDSFENREIYVRLDGLDSVVNMNFHVSPQTRPNLDFDLAFVHLSIIWSKPFHCSCICLFWVIVLQVWSSCKLKQ